MARRYQRGTVYLAGKKKDVWYGRWRESVIGSDGKVQEKRRYVNQRLGTKAEFRTEKLALRALELRVAPTNDQGYKPMRLSTFEQFAETWKAKILSQHRPSTRSVIESQLRTALTPFFGKYLVKDINCYLMQGFVQSCQKSPKTCRNYIGGLKMMWKQANAWGYSTVDPFEGLVLPKMGLRKEIFYTAEEANRIIRAASGMYKTIYWVAAETGMRPGELCGLQVEDLDFENSTIRIARSVWGGQFNTPKTANGCRQMAISPKLVEHLTDYLTRWTPNDKNLLFTITGKPLEPSAIRRWHLTPLCKQLGIPAKGMKAFRHCSATMMDQACVPEKVRQERLGHAPGSKVTQLHYTHAIGADHRNAAALMGERLTETIQ